jgi:hypothetical protein
MSSASKTTCSVVPKPVRAEDEEIKRYEKTGTVWTIEEDQKLRELVASGTDLADVAKSLSRTLSAVKARAYALRLLLGRSGVRRRGLSRWG